MSTNNKLQDNNLLEIVRQTAFNVQATNEQMGIIVSEIKGIKAKQNDQDVKLENIEGRMQHYEDTVTITSSQKGKIKAAFHKRVDELLGIKRMPDNKKMVVDECKRDYKHYWNRMLRWAYSDAKREAGLGSPIEDTQKIFVPGIFDYANNWFPNGGVPAFKAYWDKMDSIS